MAINPELLPISRVDAIPTRPAHQAWLIESLWTAAAVGIIGGAPKCCKSWLGLDMAVSVASHTPCLDRFPVSSPGPVLIFLAEDALCDVRARIQALCRHRRIELARLDLFVVTAPSLRLDLPRDQARLQNTLQHIKPRLLVLDPLVRLHRLDENSAADIAGILGFLREIQRAHDTAVVLVHHASKKARAHPGQALRGSSDLHAFGDSNAYLARRQDQMLLTLEHRATKAPEPLEIKLISRPDGDDTHLAVVSQPGPETGGASLDQAVGALLQHHPEPMTRTAIRQQLKVNNQRLGASLQMLEKKGRILKTAKGWIAGRDQPQRQLPFFQELEA